MFVSGLKRWWSCPCGVRELVVLALPLVLSTSFWTVMNFTDRMFLLWHSNAAMAASLPSGMLYFSVICFPLGVISYTGTFVAQYFGAGHPLRVGRITWQGVWVALASVPLVLATVPLAPWAFRLVGHAPEVAGLEEVYYRTMTFGAGGALLNGAFAAFFTGLGRTRVVMVVDGLAAGLNVVLDYAWVFGYWGFPEGGIAGAAWATVVAQWSSVLLYAWVVCRPTYGERYGLRSQCRFDRALVARLLRYGGPNGLQWLVEVAAFTLFVLLVGRLGTEAMAATNLAFNVNNMAWFPMLGVGIAVSTMVGQQLGANHPELAARATWTGLAVALAYMGFFAVLYLVVPNLFLLGHAAGAEPGQFEGIRQSTIVLLRFVAAYCLFDALNVIFCSAIKGAGDTRFVLLNVCLLSPLPVLATWFGTTRWGFGLLWCWSAITAWVCLLGVTYMARFCQGRWREMRVIEPDLLGRPEPVPESEVELTGVALIATPGDGNEVVGVP